MERLRRLTAAERALGAALLAVISLAGFMESRSPFAEAARLQKPWFFFLALDSPAAQAPPCLFLGLYESKTPRLEFVYLPGDTLVSRTKTLDIVYQDALVRRGIPPIADQAEARAAKQWLSQIPALAAADPVLLRGNAAPEDSPPLAALHWLKRPVRNLVIVPLSLKILGAKDVSERAFLALRLAQIPAGNIIPAWLPDDRDARYDFFGRLLSGQEPAPRSGPITVEISNAAGIPDLALDATKILRSRGADVMSSDNAANAERTMIYDRVGRVENARAVARMLACPSALAVTRVDPARLVDVSVVLAKDCSGVISGKNSWN